MALLGSSVDPRLFIQDYSGFVDAAKTQAQTMAGIGQTIGDIGKMYAERKKEQAQQEKDIKIADNIAAAVEASMPELVPNIGEIRAGIADKNRPISERHADAQSIMSVLQSGIQLEALKSNRAELAAKRETARYGAMADIRKAELDAQKEANKFTYKTLPLGDAGSIEVRAYNDGRVTDFYGNPLPPEITGRPDVAASIQTASEGEDGLGPLPLDPYEGLLPQGDGATSGPGVLPDLWDQKGKVIQPQPGQSNAAQLIEGANVAPVPVAQPGAAAAIEGAIDNARQTPSSKVDYSNIPGFKPIKKPSVKLVKNITGEEAAKENLNPLGTYKVEYTDGVVTDTSVLIAPPTERDKARGKEAKGEAEKAALAKDIALKTIDEFVDPKTGKATQKLDNAVGYGEAFATGIAEYAPFLGTQSEESRSSQQKLNRLVEGSVLEAAKSLKPASNLDIQLLIKNRPQITSPTKVWEQYFEEIKKIFKDPNSYVEADSKSSSGETETEPVSKSSLLRTAIEKKNKS